jgi:hypothetical protein
LRLVASSLLAKIALFWQKRLFFINFNALRPLALHVAVPALPWVGRGWPDSVKRRQDGAKWRRCGDQRRVFGCRNLAFREKYLRNRKIFRQKRVDLKYFFVSLRRAIEK